MYDKLDIEAVELLDLISSNVSILRKEKGYSWNDPKTVDTNLFS